MNIKEYILNNSFFIKKDFLKNSILFNQDELCDKVCYIIEGYVTIKTYTYGEKEETIINLKSGSWFGDILVFSSNPKYLGIAICQTNCKVAYISKNSLILLFNDKTFLNYYLNQICDKSLFFKQQNKLFKHKNIRDRIICYFEQNSSNKVIEISSITFLSNELSLPRPSVSRELSKMISEGLITKNKNTIYLNF